MLVGIKRKGAAGRDSQAAVKNDFGEVIGKDFYRADFVNEGHYSKKRADVADVDPKVSFPSGLAMFPDTKASRHGKGSNAKQTIWSEFGKFSKWNDGMQAQAAKLADMVMTASLDDLKTQHRLLGKTCSGCHKAYRIKKKR